MLTYDDQKILRFEQDLGGLPRWRKTDAIKRDLGLSETRYWQRLTALCQRADALEVYPQTVYRVRAIVKARAADRDARLIGRDG